MQREEKQFDAAIDNLQSRLNDFTNSIGSLLGNIDLEHQSLDWPTFMNNYALIASQITGLSKILGKESCPPLRNRTILPLELRTERDDELAEQTEGRLQTFSPDNVSDYLRTKPDPVTEQKMLASEQKASNISSEAAAKQVAQFNKAISHTLDIVAKFRAEWDAESSSRSGMEQTSSMADTLALVALVSTGKGLKATMSMPGTSTGSMMVPPVLRGPAPMSTVNQSNVNQIGGKTPSTVKTNIKSAMQIHPFSR